MVIPLRVIALLNSSFTLPPERTFTSSGYLSIVLPISKCRSTTSVANFCDQVDRGESLLGFGSGFVYRPVNSLHHKTGGTSAAYESK